MSNPLKYIYENYVNWEIILLYKTFNLLVYLLNKEVKQMNFKILAFPSTLIPPYQLPINLHRSFNFLIKNKDVKQMTSKIVPFPSSSQRFLKYPSTCNHLTICFCHMIGMVMKNVQCFHHQTIMHKIFKLYLSFFQPYNICFCF